MLQMLCGSVLVVRSHDRQIFLNVVHIVSRNLIALSNSLPPNKGCALYVFHACDLTIRWQKIPLVHVLGLK